MNPWEQLLAVQAIDSTIQKLDHRDAQLPERARLAELDEALVAVRAATAAAEEDKRGLAQDQRKIEDEVATIEERIAHEEAQLYSGGSSDAGMLQSLQDEIASLKRRISVLEDQELELMEQIEPIDARLASLASEQSGMDAEAVTTTVALAEAEASIAAERAAALQARSEAVEGIDDEALERYEKTRDRLGGTAVARLEAGACGACHLKLSAVEYDRILHLSPDEEVRCEECDRFLVRV